MNIAAKISFFYCGHGDTILVKAARAGRRKSEWGMVDCHLTKSSGAYQRVRDVVRKKKIGSLKFVCLTHPDRDHYFGMKELLQDRFVGADGRLRVEQFWDSGVPFFIFSAIAERLGTDDVRQEIDDLYGLLTPQILADNVEHWPIGPNVRPIIKFGDFLFVGLSPRHNRTERYGLSKIDEILGAPNDEVVNVHAEESNALSTILVMYHRKSGASILLGGDATADVWEEALDAWKTIRGQLPRASGQFAALKVSHHGARGSTPPRLCKACCRGGNCIAVISARTGDPDHPHPEVLDTLAKAGIRVYLTCGHDGDGESRKDRLPLPGRRVPEAGGLSAAHPGWHWADVSVTIRDDGTLVAEPPSACLPLTGPENES